MSMMVVAAAIVAAGEIESSVDVFARAYPRAAKAKCRDFLGENSLRVFLKNSTADITAGQIAAHLRRLAQEIREFRTAERNSPLRGWHEARQEKLRQKAEEKNAVRDYYLDKDFH